MSETWNKAKKIHTLKTLKKWPFTETFSAATDELRYVMPFVWKFCCDGLAHIKDEAILKGIKKGSVNVDNYIYGIYIINYGIYMFILPMWKNLLKLDEYLIRLMRNTLATLHSPS